MKRTRGRDDRVRRGISLYPRRGLSAVWRERPFFESLHGVLAPELIGGHAVSTVAATKNSQAQRLPRRGTAYSHQALWNRSCLFSPAPRQNSSGIALVSRR